MITARERIDAAATEHGWTITRGVEGATTYGNTWYSRAGHRMRVAYSNPGAVLSSASRVQHLGRYDTGKADKIIRELSRP